MHLRLTLPLKYVLLPIILVHSQTVCTLGLPRNYIPAHIVIKARMLVANARDWLKPHLPAEGFLLSGAEPGVLVVPL